MSNHDSQSDARGTSAPCKLLRDSRGAVLLEYSILVGTLALAGSVGLGTLLGWWLDKKFATSPWLLIVGLVLGLLTTALDIYQLMKKFGQLK